MTLSRLALPLYVYACPSNLLHTRPQPWLCLGLSLWLGAQVRSHPLCSPAVRAERVPARGGVSGLGSGISSSATCCAPARSPGCARASPCGALPGALTPSPDTWTPDASQEFARMQRAALGGPLRGWSLPFESRPLTRLH